MSSYQIQNKIIQENKINSEQTKAVTNSKVVEKMVDVGGIIELNIDNHNQLKQIDSKTFLPIVSTSVKSEQTTQ